MKKIDKDMWRNSAYRYEQEKKQPYMRLRKSKLPFPNLYSSHFRMLVKTCEDAEIGKFMKALYGFIYDGDVIWWYDEKLQNIWEDTLNKMNEKADWWFNKKEENQQSKKLNITKNDIDSVFRREGNYIGVIDDKQE